MFALFLDSMLNCTHHLTKLQLLNISCSLGYRGEVAPRLVFKVDGREIVESFENKTDFNALATYSIQINVFAYPRQTLISCAPSLFGVDFGEMTSRYPNLLWKNDIASIFEGKYSLCY